MVTSALLFRPDFHSSNDIRKRDGSANPEERGGNFEGDMMLDAEQIRNLDFGPRNGLILRQHRWTKRDGKVRVYYGIVKHQFCKF